MARIKSWWLPVMLVGGLTLIYTLSGPLTPSGYADSDELITIASLGSVAHPPGFPLLITLTHLLMRIFWFASPAGTANFLAGLFHALSIFIYFHLHVLIVSHLFPTLHSTKAKWSALIAAGILAFSYLWWTYATIFEMVSFTTLLTILTLYLAFRWYIQPKDSAGRYFYLTWVSAGLLVGHYQLGIAIFPALLVMMVQKWRSVCLPAKKAVKPLVLGISVLVAAFILTNLPLFWLNQSNVPVTWTFADSLDGWWGHLTRRDYTGLDLETDTKYATSFSLPQQFDRAAFQSIAINFSYLIDHLGLLSVAVIILGSWVIWRTCRRLAVVLTILWLYPGPLLAGYLKAAHIGFESSKLMGIVQRQYFIGELTFVLFAGIGTAYLLQRFKRPPAAVFALIIIGIEIIFNASVVTQKDLRQQAAMVAKTRLASAAPNALIICTNDVDCYSLFYESYINRTRPDILVLAHIDTYHRRLLPNIPETYPYLDSLPPDFFAQLVAWNIPKRPVYLTSGVNFYPAYVGLETGPFYLIPEGLMFKIVTGYPATIDPPRQVELIRSNAAHDRRDEYGKGIVEVMANNQAYAGYLSLLYHQPAIAASYLNNALILDPKNTQAIELSNHLDEYAVSMAIKPRVFTAVSLMAEAAALEASGSAEAAETLFRYATYVEPKNLQALDALIALYQKYNFSEQADRITRHKGVVQ